MEKVNGKGWYDEDDALREKICLWFENDSTKGSGLSGIYYN